MTIAAVLGLEYNTAVVLLGTLALGLSAGVVGTLALLRRRALLGDALAHSTLPGVWIAFVLFGKSFGLLMAGAMLSGLTGVALVVLLARYTRVKEDAAIGIVLSVFFGVGLTLSGLVHKHSSDASQSGIDHYLLGTTAGMLLSDALFICAVATLALAVVTIFFKELELLCFDTEFAAVQGWPVLALDFLLMLLLTATTVIGLPAVGVVLMVAMLILPGAAARFWTDRLHALLGLAGFFGLVIAAAGTFASATAERLPAGPVIVLCGALLFGISVVAAPRRGLLAQALRQHRLERRRLHQKILRLLFEHGEGEVEARPISEGDLAETLPPRRVRAALESLERADRVRREPLGCALTAQGRIEAAEIVRRHRLWERYLLSKADIDRDLVDPDAELIDRILPSAVVSQLERELEAQGRLPDVPRLGGPA